MTSQIINVGTVVIYATKFFDHELNDSVVNLSYSFVISMGVRVGFARPMANVSPLLTQQVGVFIFQSDNPYPNKERKRKIKVFMKQQRGEMKA